MLITCKVVPFWMQIWFIIYHNFSFKSLPLKVELVKEWVMKSRSLLNQVSCIYPLCYFHFWVIGLVTKKRKSCTHLCQVFRLEIQKVNKCQYVENGWICRIETEGAEIDLLVILKRVWKILYWVLQNLGQNSMLLKNFWTLWRIYASENFFFWNIDSSFFN